MSNLPSSKIYCAKGVQWAIHGDAQGPASLLVEDQDGRRVFWWLSHALDHSSEITNFDLLSADIESGRVQLHDDDLKLWQSWRNTNLLELGRKSTGPLSTS
jgi:hypothetical protein